MEEPQADSALHGVGAAGQASPELAQKRQMEEFSKFEGLGCHKLGADVGGATHAYNR